MAWDFDYARAWRDLYRPAYKCLSWDLRQLFRRVAVECSELHQRQDLWMHWPDEDSHYVHGFTEPLRANFESFDDEYLAWASQVIFGLGHYAVGRDWQLAQWVALVEKPEHLSEGFKKLVPSDELERVILNGPPSADAAEKGLNPATQEVYDAAQKEIRNYGLGGAHWKFSKYADEVLTVRLGLPLTEPHGARLHFWIDDGWLTARYSTKDYMGNYRLALATKTRLGRVRPLLEGKKPDAFEEAVEEIREQTMKSLSGNRLDAFELKPKYYTHEAGTSYSDEELEYKFRTSFNGTFIVRGIRNVNFKPHPFTIGPKHMENSGMYLDPNSAPCAVPGCKLKYEDHLSDKVMFLECARDVTEKEAKEVLGSQKIIDAMEHFEIDGFAFVESRKGYKFVKGEEGEDTDA